MRLKILWLSHFVPYPPRGGALQRSHHLLREAASRHEVELLALNQRPLLSTGTEVEDAIGALQSLGIRLEVFDIPADQHRARWLVMAAVGVLRATPYDVNWLRNAAFAKAVTATLDRERFDVIHVDTIGLIPNVPPTHYSRVALNHHNIESHMLARRAQREPRRWKRWYLGREAEKLEALEQRVCPAVGINLVVSELDADRLAPLLGAGRTAIVKNGVDVQFFQPSPQPAPPTELVFAGTMGWYPNEDAMEFFLEETWPALRDRDPSFRLTIVGRGATDRLRSLAERFGEVVVTGAVPDVRPYLQSAGIYVCPIREGGGTRLKVLDALASALPVVATPLAVEGLDLVPDRHFLPAVSGGEFVRRIEELRQSPELRQSLAANGRRFVVERFSWETIGQDLDRAYRSIAVDHGQVRRTTDPHLQGVER